MSSEERSVVQAVRAKSQAPLVERTAKEGSLNRSGKTIRKGMNDILEHFREFTYRIDPNKAREDWFSNAIPPADDEIYINQNGCVFMNRKTYEMLEKCYLEQSHCQKWCKN